MPKPKSYFNGKGRIMYVPMPVINSLNEIKLNFHVKGSKAFAKMADLADIGMEAEKTGLGGLLTPLFKRRR